MRLTVTSPLARTAPILVCRSRAMVRVREAASRLGRGPQRGLTTRERWGGKHLVARFLHQRSSRSSGPFITVAATGASEAQLATPLVGSDFRGAERSGA